LEDRSMVAFLPLALALQGPAPSKRTLGCAGTSCD
jgi:hypothetical protein